MSKYYVYMLDGQVDSKPMEISGSPDDSPNTQWGLDQMKKNNMLPCTITYDPTTEEPDYENPKIGEDLVQYFGNPISEEKRKQLINIEIEKKRQSEYPTLIEKVEALWAYAVNNDQSGINVLTNLIASVDKKYPKEV